MDAKSAVVALSALAQDSRLAIFRTLGQAGDYGLPAGKIGAATGIAPSSLTFHLKELVHADLVSSRQLSRFVIYTANYATMNELIAFLTQNCGGGSCLAACAPTDSVTAQRSS